MLLGPVFTSNFGVSLAPGEPVSTSTLARLVGGGTTAGPSVTEESSLAMPAVWRAVNLIAGTIASLPLHAYSQDGATRSRVGATGSELAADLLASPHADLTPFEFWEIVLTHQLLWGNAYLRILRNPLGRPVELVPVSPARVHAGRATDQRKYYTVDGDLGSDGKPIIYTDDTMLHIPAFGYDGIEGVPPIRLARQGISLALAAEEFGAKLFGNGSLATGILQTEQRLTQSQADRLAQRWNEKRTGLTSAHQTMVLDKGAKFEQLTIPPQDAQFIESRRFQISEVARIFGVPPHMLMDTEKTTSWGTGIEQQTIGFVVYTLRPWLTRIEQRVTRLIRPQNVYARFSLEGLLRGDSAQRAAFYKSMWELGALSTDEIRAYEELGPVADGDSRYVPLNFGPLGQAQTAPTGQESTS